MRRAKIVMMVALLMGMSAMVCAWAGVNRALSRRVITEAPREAQQLFDSLLRMPTGQGECIMGAWDCFSTSGTYCAARSSYITVYFYNYTSENAGLGACGVTCANGSTRSWDMCQNPWWCLDEGEQGPCPESSDLAPDPVTPKDPQGVALNP